MPWYNLKKMWTPLEIFGLKIYREMDDKSIWYQVGKGKKHRIARK